MRSLVPIDRGLDRPMTNVRVFLAAFWIGHFLLWTFGDMVSLLQETNEPASNSLLLFVAVPLAIIQVLMIVLSLGGTAALVRWANLGLAAVYLFFNVVYLFDSDAAWGYLLGGGYILFNLLTLWLAWTWHPRATVAEPERVEKALVH